MSFHPDQIEPEHVLKAIETIESTNEELIPSTRWLVKINNKTYPPKEVMRRARKELDGSLDWDYGGGPATNKYLERMGFKILDMDNSKLTNLKEEFIKWFFENTQRKYGSLSESQLRNDLEESQKYFDRNIFEMDESNFKELIGFLKTELYRNPDFLEYSKNTGAHRPRAILGKENYLKFLMQKFSKSQYWIFQCNPAIYDLENALGNEAVHSWKVAAHKNKIKSGDKVIIWVTGSEAKCLALGEILTEPSLINENGEERKYYLADNKPDEETRVRIKITHDLSNNPIYWNDIKELPEFQNFKAGNQGTNFSATRQEFETLLDLAKATENNSYYKIKALFPEEKSETFLNIIRGFLNKHKLSPEDERFSFNVRKERKRLVFIIGSRYALSIEKKKGKTELSFTSPKIISDNYGAFSNHKGEEEVYWNIVDDFNGLESEIENGFLTELNRGNKSPFRKYSDRQFIEDLISTKKIMDAKENAEEFELNTILYGPPGTGKTYKTKEIAVKIANPNFSLDPGWSIRERRQFIVEEYNRLFEIKQIIFTTFHQSFSYEDFVEGIKPVPPKPDGEVGYRVIDGIFKTLCLKAAEEKNSFNFDVAYSNFVAEVIEKGMIELETPVQKKPFNVRINSYETSVAIPKTENAPEMGVTKEMLKDYIVNGIVRDWKPYTLSIGNYLKDNFGVSVEKVDNNEKNFVLIIDEINRGNVSAIFGELITLIESDKRRGRAEEIKLELPYSKEEFSVPPNVFIIGTMNTADRSVEALDTALRRRFSFEEVMPLPGLLEEIEFKGFNLREVLITINNRIETLLDRDHTIGHSYFIKIKSGDTQGLQYAFENKVIPLLQEYFYHDYEKIALILGEGFVERKESNISFAKFKNVDPPEMSSSFKLKKVHNIEETIRILLNRNDEES